MKKSYILPSFLALTCLVAMRTGAASAYPEGSEQALRVAREELDRRGLTILPTPKEIAFGLRDLTVKPEETTSLVAVVAPPKHEVAAQWIADRLREMGGGVPRRFQPGERVDGAAVEIRIIGPEGQRPGEVPERPQGYAVTTADSEGLRVYTLAGHDDTGALYAAVTFAACLQPDGTGSLVFPDLTLRDWPDVLYREIGRLEWPYRRRFRWPRWRGEDTNAEYAKRYIDWCLAHKINRVRGPSIGTGSNFDHVSGEERSWMREVNDYAAARGIRAVLSESFAVGTTQRDGDRPEFQDCMELRGLLFSWGDDVLLSNKVDALDRLIHETGFGGVSFHSADTRNSNWDARGRLDRERFGDDRIAGDIHVVSHLHRLRASHPDLELLIVPRPYIGNLDRPGDLVYERGEISSAEDMERFSAGIPEDVFVCLRESNPASHHSWKRRFRQPLYMYIAMDRSMVFLSGRLLRPTFRYMTTWFEPGSEDWLFAVGHEHVTTLGAAEFAWNTRAPGHAVWEVPDFGAPPEDMTQQQRRTLLSQYDVFSHAENAEDIRDLVRRACRMLFGSEAAPHFEPAFFSVIDRDYIFNMQEYLRRMRFLRPHVLADAAARQAHMERIADEAEAAVHALHPVWEDKTLPAETRAWAAWFLCGDHPLVVIAPAARAMALAMQADLASRSGEIEDAQRMVAEARAALSEARLRLEALWPDMQEADSFKPIAAFRVQAQRFDHIQTQVDMLAVKVESRADEPDMTEAQPPAVTEVQRAPRVALYDPRGAGGLVFGADGLFTLFNSRLDMQVERTDDLSAENLERFDVLVLPDCKRFGSRPVDVHVLRNFVRTAGKGLLLEHDSCGFHRFPFQTSIFPEIAQVVERVGRPVVHPQHDPRERKVFVAADHPAAGGYPRGTAFEHGYYDHFRLDAMELTEVVLRDAEDAPVMVAGQAGRGRVLFSGLLTLRHDDAEWEDPLPPPEGDLLCAAVIWLAGREGARIALEEIRREERVEPDGIYSFIWLRPDIVTAVPLTDAVLTATVRRPDDFRLLEEDVVLARIGAIDRRWIPDEPLLVQTPAQKTLLLTLTLRADQGVKNKVLLLE